MQHLVPFRQFQQTQQSRSFSEIVLLWLCSFACEHSHMIWIWSSKSKVREAKLAFPLCCHPDLKIQPRPTKRSQNVKLDGSYRLEKLQSKKRQHLTFWWIQKYKHYILSTHAKKYPLNACQTKEKLSCACFCPPVFNNHANFNPDEVETFWKMHSLFSNILWRPCDLEIRSVS